MPLRPRLLPLILPRTLTRTLFGASSTPSNSNRLFDPIRTPHDLQNLALLSAAANRPLITLWTASWCTQCQAVAPVVRRLVAEERVGEAEGGLGYAEVEMDGTLIGDAPVRFMISSMPTLLAFSRQEPQQETKLTRPEQMRDEGFLREWLVREAGRGGRKGGGGGSIFGLGGLFGGSGAGKE